MVRVMKKVFLISGLLLVAIPASAKPLMSGESWELVNREGIGKIHYGRPMDPDCLGGCLGENDAKSVPSEIGRTTARAACTLRDMGVAAWNLFKPKAATAASYAYDALKEYGPTVASFAYSGAKMGASALWSATSCLGSAAKDWYCQETLSSFLKSRIEDIEFCSGRFVITSLSPADFVRLISLL